MRKLLAIVLILVVALGCSDIVGITGERPIEPRASWYNDAMLAQTCLEERGLLDEAVYRVDENFDKINWFLAESIQHSDTPTGHAGGLWVKPHKIVLVGHGPLYISHETLRHEVIHWMYQGLEDHPERYFACSDP